VDIGIKTPLGRAYLAIQDHLALQTHARQINNTFLPTPRCLAEITPVITWVRAVAAQPWLHLARKALAMTVQLHNKMWQIGFRITALAC
jgi:hypothetical protein